MNDSNAMKAIVVVFLKKRVLYEFLAIGMGFPSPSIGVHKSRMEEENLELQQIAKFFWSSLKI